MDRWLIVVGASIFGLLGAAHLVFTLFTNRFDTRDPKVGEAMKGTSPVLTRETTMWRAWVGFNVSHSLGALLLPAVYIPLAIAHLEVIRQSLWFSALPLVVSGTYLVLAKKYWFSAPFTGIALASLCFAGALVTIHV